MTFFAFAASMITKLVISVASRSLGRTIDDVKIERRMARMVEDAVDRIVGQSEQYLHAEKVTEARKEVLIAVICAKLQPLADDPQRFFAGDLDGARIFKQCHPEGQLPQEIREEQLDQFYSVLFPQIAHFLAGSRIALGQWQAEEYREEFKRLSDLADEISQMSAKVTDLPGAVVGALTDEAGREAQTLLREFAQTLLNNLLLRLDLAPLRAERALYGSLGDHFVIPPLRQRHDNAEALGQEEAIVQALAAPGVRAIVHGGAGVGKTTWCLWLQSRLLQADPSRLTLVLRLRETTDIERHSLLDLLRSQAGTHLRDALTDKVLRDWHATGRLVVILDGFDEVPEARRDAVEKWIKDLTAVAHKTAVLVTSRPLQSGHLEKLKKPWQQWDLLPFDEPRIVEFITRWHRYLPEGELSPAEREIDAASLARTFSSDPSLSTLANTPLMLGTLLFVHHRDRQLPSGRVDLYERYIAAMLGLRDQGLGIDARATSLSDREKRRVLAHIGLHFHLQQVNQVNDDTMRQLVTDALARYRYHEDVDRLLDALCERTGLLQGPGTWSFTHKTIGEFLVADLICDGGTRLRDNRRLDRRELWRHWAEDPWTAVLFFWAGMTTSRELEEFIRDLTDEGSHDAALLALSLLHDQGDRLEHEMQRALAVRVIASSHLGAHTSHSSACCATPPAPSFAFRDDIKVSTFRLRGLAAADSNIAVERLFERNILAPGDINDFGEDIREHLIVSAMWSLQPRDTSVTLDIRHHMQHLPLRDVALYCFQYYVAFCRMDSRMDAIDKAQYVNRRLEAWLSAFPQGRSWVPLLLAGCLYECHEQLSWVSNNVDEIARLLWQWRDEPIREQWLLGSDACQEWLASERFCLLKATSQLLERHGPDNMGITADMVAWCDRLIAQRAELMAAKAE